MRRLHLRSAALKTRQRVAVTDKKLYNDNALPVSVLPPSHEPHGHFPSPVRVRPTRIAIGPMSGPVSFDFPQKYKTLVHCHRALNYNFWELNFTVISSDQHLTATTGIVACGNPEVPN